MNWTNIIIRFVRLTVEHLAFFQVGWLVVIWFTIDAIADAYEEHSIYC